MTARASRRRARGGILFVTLVAACGTRAPVGEHVRTVASKLETAEWVQRTPTTSPAGRSKHAMTYDAARHRTVLFGGYGASGIVGDTWEWDGTSWVQRAPTTSPSARPRACNGVRQRAPHGRSLRRHVEQARRRYMGWDGTSWTHRTPASSPPARRSHAMAYDSARGKIVLFGGFDYTYTNPDYADTWEWDGTNWTSRTPTSSPPPRDGHVMAYDGAHGKTVLFSGSMTLATSDTWEWDGSSWTRRTPAMSPGWRYGSGLAFDSLRGQTVLFGGEGNSRYSDTWEWDGTNWTRTFPATPPPGRSYFGLVFDSVRNRTVIFGGGGGSSYPILADT